MAFFRTVSFSEQLPAIAGDGVLLRAPQMGDYADWAALREASREAQNTVSTKLARQVLGSLYELLRGFVAADGRDAEHRLQNLAQQTGLTVPTAIESSELEQA